jgi:hypothetical protein
MVATFLTTAGVRFVLNKESGKWEPMLTGSSVSASTSASTGASS